MFEIDDIDRKILLALSNNARVSMRELSRIVGMTSPSVAERVHRLEDQGIVTGYAAQVDIKKIGHSVKIFLRLRPLPGLFDKVCELVNNTSEIVSCDRVTGDDCLIAVAYLPSVEGIACLLDSFLPYASTSTSVVQHTLHSDRHLPLISQNN